jgi:phosphoglycerate dehydrogenase-like enzyme
MRIHIQNHPRQPVVFLVTPEHWAEAAARAGAAGEGHAVSFGASEAEFAAVAAEVEVLVTGPAALKHLLPALQPERAPALRLIFSTSAGVDGLAAAEMPAVPFANNRGAHAEKAGEFVIMALLMLANGMPAFIEDQKNRHWAQRFTRGLRGRRLTVLGLGAMGGAAAEQAAHFGMRVTGIRATPRPHPACERVLGMEALDEVLPETDFLLLSCPLTEATRRILDRRRGHQHRARPAHRAGGALRRARRGRAGGGGSRCLRSGARAVRRPHLADEQHDHDAACVGG